MGYCTSTAMEGVQKCSLLRTVQYNRMSSVVGLRSVTQHYKQYCILPVVHIDLYQVRLALTTTCVTLPNSPLPIRATFNNNKKMRNKNAIFD